jgi:hypothetical protein
MPLVTRVQVPGMDASAFRTGGVTLADGTKISLLSGSPLPKAYHETSRSSSSHTFSWTRVGQDVFVQTDLSELEEQIKRQEGTSQNRHTLRSAKTQIRKYWEAWTCSTYTLTRVVMRELKTWTTSATIV